MIRMHDDNFKSSIVSLPAIRSHEAGEMLLLAFDRKAEAVSAPFPASTHRPSLEFIYCLNGKADIRITAPERASLRLCQDSAAAVFLPGAEGDFFIHEPGHFQALILQVNHTLLRNWEKRQGVENFLRRLSEAGTTGFCLRDIPFPLLQSSLVWRTMSAPEPDPLADIFTTAKAYDLFYLQLELLSKAFPEQGKVSAAEYTAAQKVYRHLQLNIASTPSLPDLAAMAGLNRNHLTTAFRKIFGDTVFGILRRERLKYACRLLAHDLDKNITEIAYICGFSNPGHLTKSFLAEYGVTPSIYRRKKPTGPQCY